MPEFIIKIIELLLLFKNFSMMFPCLVASYRDGCSNVRCAVHATTAYNVKSSVFLTSEWTATSIQGTMHCKNEPVPNLCRVKTPLGDGCFNFFLSVKQFRQGYYSA